MDERDQYLAGAVFELFEADGVTPVANPYGQGRKHKRFLVKTDLQASLDLKRKIT